MALLCQIMIAAAGELPGLMQIQAWTLLALLVMAVVMTMGIDMGTSVHPGRRRLGRGDQEVRLPA